VIGKPRRLRENIAALGLVQLATYAFPLIAAAYSARVLGAESWGRVAIVQGVLAYVAVFTNWGFAWSATSKIAANRENPEAVASILAATVGAQVALTIVAASLLLLLMATVQYFYVNARYYAWGIAALASASVATPWLFSGLERMRESATIQIISRVVSLALILILVRGPNDAALMIAAGAAGNAFGSVLTAIWARHSVGRDWRRPKAIEVWRELRCGASLFASTVWVSLYINLTPLIVGSIAGTTVAGHFVLADRIRQAAQSTLAPLTNALFPRMSRLVRQDPELAGSLMMRGGALLIAASAMVSALLFAGAEHLVGLIGGSSFIRSAEALRWLAPLPFIMSFSTHLGQQVMLSMGRVRAFSLILLAAAVLSLTLIFPLVKGLGANGAAITLCIVEAFVSVLMIAYVSRTRLFRNLRTPRPN
jgi:PST family polysaccharide transporter